MATRRKKVNSTIEDPDYEPCLEEFETNSQLRSRKRAKSKNSSGGRKGSTKRTRKVVSEVTELDSDSCDSSVSETIKYIFRKKIETKVDNFFQSNNLLSDEEDENQSITKKLNAKENDVYVLSDSEEELNTKTLSNSAPFDKTAPDSNEVLESEQEPPKTLTKTAHHSQELVESTSSKINKETELLEFVDNILLSSGAQTPPEPDDWNEFTRKTKEIFEDISALLAETIASTSKNVTTNVEDQMKEKPSKSVRICAVCLEELNENVSPGATKCGHIFCLACIKEVAKQTKSCPTCRKRITPKSIIPLYL